MFVCARKTFVATDFLSVLDYRDFLYMNTPANCLQSLDSVYHSAGLLQVVEPCKLYAGVVLFRCTYALVYFHL